MDLSPGRSMRIGGSEPRIQREMGRPVTGDWLVFTVFLALHQRDDPGSQMDGRIESKEG